MSDDLPDQFPDFTVRVTEAMPPGWVALVTSAVEFGGEPQIVMAKIGDSQG